jgi:hypothetical protein
MGTLDHKDLPELLEFLETLVSLDLLVSWEM